MRKLLIVSLIGAVFWIVSRDSPGPSSLGLSASVAWWADAVGPRMKPLLDPVLTWAARDELRMLARDLRKRQESFQPLPHPNRFRDHIRQNLHTGRDGLDPWGNEYYLVITLDSVIVGSPGPDGIRNTEEDLHIGWLRGEAGLSDARTGWLRVLR